ncbi:MAG: 30S ribosomal protein S16 [Saprospirales bacterium]|nr:30S ribosomal protein S16 [Saprospirales bacterium]
MAVKIRLQRKGKKKKPYYHIVIADARAPRDGKFIERIGFYNPQTVPATIEVDREKAYDWLQKGAQPTDTVRAMLRLKGVYYLRHLMRGVKKGALTEEQANKMYKEWVDAKEAKLAKRAAEWRQKVAEANAKVAGLHITTETVKKEVPKVEVAEKASEEEE